MALHVPRGIYTIVVSIRLDYCRRDCATSPSWSPAMKNCRASPGPGAGCTYAVSSIEAKTAMFSAAIPPRSNCTNDSGRGYEGPERPR